MTWLQFIASLFHDVVSLAWPAALVMSVWLFRERLGELLPRLRLKHKDWEISFRLQEAEKVAEQLPPPPPEQAPPTPEETKGFAAIAKVSPRAAILEVRANLDGVVRSLAEAMRGTITGPGGRETPLYMLIRDLRQKEVIDEKTSEILDHLRVIGNSVAHGRGLPTEDDAIQFGQLAERVIAQLEAETKSAFPIGLS